MTLYIGSMMPDRSLEESELIKSIIKIASNLSKLRDYHAQKRAPILDVVFLLPSGREKADFKGLRLHSFDTSEQILRIEAAVPENMVDSANAERYAVAIVLDAIDAAKEFFYEQNILFDADAHMALMDTMITKEAQPCLS
ncbi:hypothetical protein [Methylomonas sp. MgM2]